MQIGNKTHAQANVAIGVNFGRRTIRDALVKSLNTAKIEWLHRPVKGEYILLPTWEFVNTGLDWTGLYDTGLTFEPQK